MTLRLRLIAHGDTAAQRAGRFPNDEGLLDRTPRTYVSGRGRVLIAPERRTRETASALGIDGAIETTIASIDLGCWSGQVLEDADHDEFLAWITDADYSGHGGESLNDHLARVEGWIRSLGDGTFTAVTHPSVVRAAVAVALGGGPTAFWRVDIEPWTATDVTVSGSRWAVRRCGLPLSLTARNQPVRGRSTVR